MSKIGLGKFFGWLSLQLKKLFVLGQGKPVVLVEEYEREHFLLYHGLIGSTPDNERQLLDVRSDIDAALDEKSTAALATALKLSPLLWEEKLSKIALALDHPYQQVLSGLLLTASPDNSLVPASLLLEHEDFRVRANTALLISCFGLTEALPALRESVTKLDKAITKAAFCYLSYSLAKLDIESALSSLSQHLYDGEDWFRVDAIRALCLGSITTTGRQVMSAFLIPHRLSDYSAVTIARAWNILELLDNKDPVINTGAYEVVIETLQAAHQTFTAELIRETGIDQVLPVLLKHQPTESVRRMLAAISLATWSIEQINGTTIGAPSIGTLTQASQVLTGSHPELVAQLQELLKQLNSDAVLNYLETEISLIHKDNLATNVNIRRLIQLASILQMKSLVARLHTVLVPGFVWLDEAVMALGNLHDSSSVAPLITLARTLINVDERINYPLSDRPIIEASPQQARTYWLILCALGQLPTIESFNFLVNASRDFAADKRQQAYESLLNVASHISLNLTQNAQISQVFKAGLGDPYLPVKLISVRAVASFHLSSEITTIAHFTGARQLSLSKAAFHTLTQMADAGHFKEIYRLFQGPFKKHLNTPCGQEFFQLLHTKNSDLEA